MQYLLSEREYRALITKKENQEYREKVWREDREKKWNEDLFRVCKLAAMFVPDPKTGKPLGCIHSTDGAIFCNRCQAEKVCPSNAKRYSK